MKSIFIGIFSLFVFSFLSLNLSAQYGPQFDNRGFEQWTERVSEPVHWHSGGTATGTFSGFVSSQIETSTQTRPGSTGSKSARVFPTSVLGITANGNITNGRMNAGSMSATGSSNYNYTQRSQGAYNTPINQLPDSISVWVCFRSQSTSDKAQVKAVVHGDADYKFIANGTEEPTDKHVATAVLSFTRTSTANGAYTWRRLSIPFNNNGPCNDVRYILFTATTNETPGTGSTSDDLFIDDVLLIYKPTLRLGNLNQTQFKPDESININIIGTIPSVPNGDHYRVRVVSTNYPMIGENVQEICISDTLDINENTFFCCLYPNPFTTTLNVITEDEVKSIRVYDVNGRMLKEQFVSGTQFNLDMSELSIGTYLLQIDHGLWQSFHRMMKTE